MYHSLKSEVVERLICCNVSSFHLSMWLKESIIVMERHIGRQTVTDVEVPSLHTQIEDDNFFWCGCVTQDILHSNDILMCRHVLWKWLLHLLHATNQGSMDREKIITKRLSVMVAIVFVFWCESKGVSMLNAVVIEIWTPLLQTAASITQHRNLQLFPSTQNLFSGRLV